MSLTIGVDPGLAGAIAAVTHNGDLHCAVDMPVIDKDVNPSLVAHLLHALHGDTWELSVVVENVHSMPKQGVASSFKFGKSFGIVLGVVAALGCPVELVTPTTWKRAMKVTADKETSRRRAIELWPGQAQLFARKRDNGRAEAALLALWGNQRRPERPRAGPSSGGPVQIEPVVAPSLWLDDEPYSVDVETGGLL